MSRPATKRIEVYRSAVGVVYRYEQYAPLGIYVWYGFEAFNGSHCSQSRNLERMMDKANGVTTEVYLTLTTQEVQA